MDSGNDSDQGGIKIDAANRRLADLVAIASQHTRLEIVSNDEQYVLYSGFGGILGIGRIQVLRKSCDSPY